MVEARNHYPRPFDWANVMAEHYPRACRVIRRLMPSHLRSMYDPEDFVGEAIVQLMAHPDRFVHNPLESLILVARRRMIDAARSPRNQVVPLDVDILDPQPSATLEHDAAELRDWIVTRVNNPRERTIIELRCLGHPLPDIARFTGIGVRKLQRFWKQFKEANEP